MEKPACQAPHPDRPKVTDIAASRFDILAPLIPQTPRADPMRSTPLRSWRRCCGRQNDQMGNLERRIDGQLF